MNKWSPNERGGYYFDKSVSISYAISIGMFTFIIGMLFGWVRKKTGSLYACAAMHGIYGLINHLFVAAP